MSIKMTLEEILAVAPDKCGWRNVNGNRVKIGGGAVIGDKARIGDKAVIGGWAMIGDRAKIGGCARIGGWAVIGDRAVIGGCARIGDSVTIPVYCSAPYSIHWYSIGEIKSGCIVKSIDWWRENVERCAEENGYNEFQQQEYKLYVAQIAAWESMMISHGKIGTVNKPGACTDE